MNYLAVFDKSGLRITSYVLGIHGQTIDDLKHMASANYPDALQVEMGPEEHAKYTSGKYKYDLSSKSAVEIIETDDEKLIDIKNTKLIELQGLLNQTDYQAIKYAEGAITAEQYAALKVQRTTWRAAYNAVQSAVTLDALNAITYSNEIPSVE